ncbi:MAG: hypothetical protein KF886_03230 [Candidatus Hydrogenedentes bacterium]|nr:hypothetical protein [Candidatus Hydrogenedentota bacterium]
MGRQTITVEELDDIRRQCAALQADWERLYQIAAAASDGSAAERELALIQLQGRLSCDYPVLAHWRKANFGLASGINNLVARAGSMAAFARDARAGNGPLLRDWQAVQETITRVRGLLEAARDQARAGKPVKLPKEVAAAVERDPWPIELWMRKLAVAGAVLAGCGLLFLLMRPYLLETRFFKWLDKSYNRWELRNYPEFQPPPNS